MKILVLTWEYAPRITGGLGVACRAICEALERLPGVQVEVALPAPPRQDHSGAADASSGYAGYATVMGETEAYEARVVAEYGSRQFDVIHAHDWLTFRAGIALSKKTGAPLMVHVHSIEADRAPLAPHGAVTRIEAEGFAHAAQIFAVSRYTKSCILRHYCVPDNKVTVVHNSGAQAQTPPAPLIALEKRARRVTFIGRITTQKGPDFFAAAAALMAEADSEMEFSIVGVGDMMTQVLESMSKQLQRRVTFHQFISAPAVRELLGDTRVFVMPSRSEPFGIAAFEAIEAGAPVVTTPNAGFRELVSSVTTVEPENAAEMARACLLLAEETERATVLAKQASQEARRWTWDCAAKAIHATMLRYAPSEQMRHGVASMQ